MTRNGAHLESRIGKTCSWLFLFAFFALLRPTAFAAPAHAARGENFEPVPCSTFKISDADAECGYVRVPEYHAQPNGSQIKLAVAILPRTSSPRATDANDAFVVAQGGPGGSTLDLFTSFFEQPSYPAIKDLRAARDIVMYDQRGTLYAQPSLQCPEELENTIATIDKDISHEESARLGEQAALACHDRLVKQGIHLDAYNSIENALDIEDVRRALGYDKFDFYGVSYGTLLALHGLRETPSTFRSVILDAVVPTQLNPNSAVAESQNRAFQELFTRCAADADCNRAYPNLQQVFYDEVDALNQKAVRVPITDKDTGKTYDAVIDGDTWMNLLFQFIYNTELVPALPKMIYDARDGVYTLVEAFYPIVVFDRTFAGGMYYSVMCAEDADFTVNDLALDGVDPHIAKAQTRDTAWFLELCQKWNVPQLGAKADVPVQANVPTLVFSGDFDPITPPPFGQAAAATITPSYVFEFPAYGHGSMTSGNCPIRIVVSFVQNPEQAPAAACIRTDATNVNFVTPTNYILSAGVGKMQLAMLQGKIEFFIVPLVLVLLLLSVWLVAPIVWLIQYVQHRPADSLAARLVPWLGALASAGAFAFFVIVFALLIVAAVQNTDTISLVLGARRAWLVVYLIPLFYTFSAIGIVIAVARAWQRGGWGFGRRLYYAVLALASVGLVVWFGVNGILFAFLN